MSLSALLNHWRSDPSIFENIADWRLIPAKSSQTAPFPDEIHPAILNALHQQNIQNLYSHQATTWDLIRSGQHVVIVTGTASGKSLAYNLPILQQLLQNPYARALYLFPTKALTQDQLTKLRQLSKDLPLNPNVYDGDTPIHARSKIRESSRVILSNPDMLHTGILPHHTHWADFLRNLQFVVIDEIHTYRGIFGSHISNVLRRLRRITRFYGADPQFILTSATIANPMELAEKLIEAPVHRVQEDGSPHGPRHFLIYNPPIIDQELGLRRSALLESVRLVEDLIHYDVQSIVFGRARRTVEILLTYLREGTGTSPSSRYPFIQPNQQQQYFEKQNQRNTFIRGYRSGYLPQQRREIEHGLQKGEVRVVIATNALELGIDIGDMGAAVLAGYPGTIASTWQQAGRAGRGEMASLTLLVTTANPLDQFLAHHPEYFFERSAEQALINPDNLLILLAHIRCAAFELPFEHGEPLGRVESERVEEYLKFLIEQGEIHHSKDKYFWMADRYPAEQISLRSASSQGVLLQIPQSDTWVTIGEVDRESATWMVHPNAVYLHEAQIFLVEDLDLENHIAHLQPTNIDYYTEPRTEITIQLLEIKGQEKVKGAQKSHGDIQVSSQVTGYRKVKWFTHEQLGIGELSLPSIELLTTGYWLVLSKPTIERLKEQRLWTNDPNEYGSSWPLQRELARARDGYRCQVCGLSEQGRSHDVHHKIPFRSFTSAEQAHHLVNLITLCSACHRRVETAVRMRSGLAGLAYLLGNLAPLFLMCDTRDLGVHFDPQSPLSTGEPTIVLFDRIPAGIGFSQRLFELHDELIRQAYDQVSQCGCNDGCPSCIGPAGENGLGGKKETLAILELLVT